MFLQTKKVTLLEGGNGSAARGEVKEETFMKSNVNGSSHQRCSVKKGVLKNFENFMGKHLCFPGKFAKFLGTPILKNICERLLLHRACG